MSNPAMAVDMRHTKLNAQEAALIAGEIVKPSWASRNEGIHERVSFDDTLWGFELAGGVFYKTPLRVVYVKPGSRADQACIKKGDTVLRINDIDTATLTLQEAHDIVVESGIHLKISVTSPDDEEDAYYTYEDQLADESRIAEELRKAMEAERIRRALERAQRTCSLPWPWVKRKIIIYRESNCFLVPSKFENKHKEQFPDLPHVRFTDDICEFNASPKEIKENNKPKENGLRESSEELGEQVSVNEDFENIVSDIDETEQNKIIDQILKESEDVPIHNDTSDAETDHSEMNGEVVGPDNEEDSLSYIKEDDEVAVEERLENDVDETKEKENDNEKQMQKGEINENSEQLNQTKDETENFVQNIPSFNIENGDEDNESNVDIENSELLNEEVVKSEDESVVDSIVGSNEHDGDFSDSINER